MQNITYTKTGKPKNCNIVLVKYDQSKNMVSEKRIKSNVLFETAQRIVRENKQALYFYVIGSINTVPQETRNYKCIKEYAKEIVD